MKKNNHLIEGPPPEAEAVGVMAQFDALREVLSETHAQIPRLLARQRNAERALGLTETEELQRQLADVVAERESAVRRRAAAIAAITELEPQLQAERGRVQRDRQAYAIHAVAQFRARYDAAVADLQALWETGRALGAALRCEVQMPLPVRVATSPIDGTSRAMPPVVDAEAVRLGESLDRVDGALSLCNAIRQARTFDSQQHHLGLRRGASSEHGGVYRVIQEFNCLTDGLPFAAGQLIDESLIGGGMRHRLMTGKRYLAPVELEAA